MSFFSCKNSRRCHTRPMPTESTNYLLSVNAFAKSLGGRPKGCVISTKLCYPHLERQNQIARSEFCAPQIPSRPRRDIGGSSLPNARRICEPKIGCSTTYHRYPCARSDSSTQSSAP